MKIINSHNLLSFLSEYLPANPIIIEAGAFNGTDTKKMASFWPSATIHAFEPVPEIFKALIEQTASYPTIQCYPVALSNRMGTATFYIAQNPKRPEAICQAGSLHEPKERLQASSIIYPHTAIVNTITMHNWATAHSIDYVDFVWLDMQGHELTVLQASPLLIKTAYIVYLEVNFIPAYQNQPTALEINTWMESQGFIAIARDFKDKPTHFFGNMVYLNTAKNKIDRLN